MPGAITDFYNKFSSPMKKTITQVFPNRFCLHSLTKLPVLHNFLKHRNLRTAIVLIGLIFTVTKLTAQPYCTMACNNSVNVSLPASCEGTITYDMILEGGNNPAICLPNGPQAFVVTVMDLNGTPLPTSPIVTGDYIGQTLSVKIKHWSTGNVCWGSIVVQDKLAPLLTCPPDVTVSCTANTAAAATGTATASDCSDFSVTHYDVTQNNGCNGSFVSVITRTWTATDEYNNTRTCHQIIRIAQPASTSVQWPPNRDGFAAPAVNCVNPNTNPSNTGSPMINGQPIPNGSGYCNMAVTYTDQTLPLCQNSYKILRTWTVVAWCTSAILTNTQVIAVKDSKPPTLTCPADLTAGTTSSVNCKASIILPTAGVTDDCSTSFNATMTTPAGLVNGNGGVIHNVSLGVYNVVYNIADNCGNAATCTVKLTVVDDDAPTVVCDQNTVVTLTSNGTALVYAQTFDDGSYDNCGPVTFSVRRMNDGCGTTATFGPTVKLCCADVGTDVQVVMKATDYVGNSNTCMVIVRVFDKDAPAISCPANKTIACTADPNNLTLAGEPTVVEACTNATVTHTDVTNLNMCNVGTITRTWKATDAGGNSSTCVQTITLQDNTPPVITFPPNYAVTGCVSIGSLDPANLPAPYNYPVLVDDCEILAVAHEDQVFTVAPPACFKIVRKWKIIEWCAYQPGGTAGYWEGTQIIMVTDNTPPTFTCPANLAVGVEANCKGTVTLPQITDATDCSQNVTVAVSSNLGNGYGPFNNVNPGVYNATYHVFDGCGNTSTCSISITVKDDKKPTPYCEYGLVIEMMNSQPPMAQVWANDFNVGSFDNCPGTLKFSFSANVNDIGKTFDCDDIGQIPIQMWVTDAAGNQDYCETFLVLQDNMNQCGGGSGNPLTARVGGAITNEQGNSVTDVMVSVNDPQMPSVMTDANGNFYFDGMLVGNDYTVSPEKDAGLLNGVTTFDIILLRRHVLGLELLNSPYKMLAADVNRSGSITTFDIVSLQKAVLLIDDQFPNNKSWRFVDAAYVFPNPANPFVEPVPEVYNINDLGADMNNVSFKAIKVGDLNGNANPGFASPATGDRSGGSLTLQLQDQSLEPGKEIALDFTAIDFENITGYQFALGFDPSALEFVRFEKGVLPGLSESDFGFRYLEHGLLTTSWNDPASTSVPADAALFTLVFKAKRRTHASAAVWISSTHTPAEAYTKDNDLFNITMQFYKGESIASSLIPHSSSLKLNARPNPFKDAVVIGFNNPEPGEATLTVFDYAGRVVKTVRGQFFSGYNEFRITAGDLQGAGAYYFRLDRAGEVEMGKLVLMD